MNEKVEMNIPCEPLTPELLEDGSYLKKAISICNNNRTENNVVALFRILRDSNVWIPCNAIMSDADYEAWTKAFTEAQEKDDLDSLVGQEFVSQDNIRMVPDILTNGEVFFFPVFTSAEEMGEYGEPFSKVGSHFLGAANLAVNNEKDVVGIVINPFTEAFFVPEEVFDIIAKLESSIEE